ncbi:MAG TPA: tetratricopeptide repeat protein [Pirellulales bacterium]|nr:tetratricopeptide repeat protein [Pirellulales bacterium]
MSRTLTPLQPSDRRAEFRANAWYGAAVCGALMVAVLLTFSRTFGYGFLKIDDGSFVYNEPHVANGFSWSGIVWAFTGGPLQEWYPLAVLSHMLDCQIYGLDPAGHHATNVLLHAATAVTLFLALWRMTGNLWPSALVAALFALHPLRVESVAWIAERRDVLSGLCFTLTLAAYDAYVRHPRSLGRYLAVCGLFALGLTAKPMLVTLPPLLVLLDYWPLERLGPRAAAFSWRPVIDKLPLFGLAFAVAVVTLETHKPWFAPLALSERLASAAVGCVAYLGQMFVPIGLSGFYCHPEAGLPTWQVAAAVILLLVISAAVVIWRKPCPYLFVGWFWYLGMLVPVSGLTPVGGEARADRYTYLPQIGLDIALVWGAMRLLAAWPARRWVFGIGSALVLVVLMACTWRQTGFWRNDKTLWEHALACDPHNVRAHYMLGNALSQIDEARAVAEYNLVLERAPTNRDVYGRLRALAHFYLGDIEAGHGNTAAAAAHYEQALELEKDFAAAEASWGLQLAKEGKLAEAIARFERSLAIAPDNVATLCYLAAAQSQHHETDEAIANYRQALKIDGNSSLAHRNLGILLAQRQAQTEAIQHFRRAIEIDPDDLPLYREIAGLLRQNGKTSEANRYEETGKKAGLRVAEAQNLRGTELVKQGKMREAIALFRTAVAAGPGNVAAHLNLADALASQGLLDEARVEYRKALTIAPDCVPAKQYLEQLDNR